MFRVLVVLTVATSIAYGAPPDLHKCAEVEIATLPEVDRATWTAFLDNTVVVLGDLVIDGGLWLWDWTPMTSRSTSRVRSLADPWSAVAPTRERPVPPLAWSLSASRASYGPSSSIAASPGSSCPLGDLDFRWMSPAFVVVKPQAFQ